jgi:hypothetical protein
MRLLSRTVLAQHCWPGSGNDALIGAPGPEIGPIGSAKEVAFVDRPCPRITFIQEVVQRRVTARRLFQWDHRGNVDLDNHPRPSELADGEERMGGHRDRSERFLAALAKVKLISHVS